MKSVLIGPFLQVVTLKDLPLKGPLQDEQLEIMEDAGIWVEEGRIKKIGNYKALKRVVPAEVIIDEMEMAAVALPGFIDCHTHLCFGGERSRDYAMRIAGKPYLEIARAGGGIWDSVTKTRNASEENLLSNACNRANRHLSEGVTTMEVKSGYGLDLQSELKMLRAIKRLGKEVDADIISTCLAAHIKPRDFEGSSTEYLEWLSRELLPQLKENGLTNRIDIFIEDTAFGIEESKRYLLKARMMGFEVTVHADQFTSGGSQVAVETKAVSADHLEASTEKEVKLLANSDTVAVALPGASVGLGCPFTPARQLLDAGACVAIASDWNPGSAPMGDLLVQASILSTFQKLSTAETFAGMTFRAAQALSLTDRGRLVPGMQGDIQAYPISDFREILYNQGKIKPFAVWKEGRRLEF